MDADFSQLYVQLGLRPDCSLEQLKQAYRRRVADLHPDRQPQAASTPDPESIGLSELIQLYGAAMQFHRQYGRLPGASARSPMPRVTPTSTTPSPAPVAAATTIQDLPRSGVSLRNSLVVLGIVAAAAYLLLSAQHEPAAVSAPAAVADEHGATTVASDALTPGLDMETVRTILGTPSYERETVWEYGPSWIRFEKGRLVEWYSSPLYPLHVQDTAPALSTPQPDPRQ